MKRVVFALVFVSLAADASAQILPLAIHGHPQRTFYTDVTQYRCVDGQFHWTPGDAVVVPPPASPMTSHVPHIKLCGPLYAEFNQPFRIDFTMTLFHANGRVADFFPGILQGRPARDVVWDETGTSTMPPFNGNPMGIVQKTGHFTVDPDPNYPHGWIALVASSAVVLVNGDAMRQNTLFPVFSTYDTTKPVDSAFPLIASRATPNSPRRPDVQFGSNQIDIFDMIPIAPISKPWSFRMNPFRYGTLSNLPTPILTMLLDMDLHNGIPGKVLTRIVDPAEEVTLTLDPLDIGPGPHKVGIFFLQPDGGLEAATSVATLDVTVGDDVPPPPPLVCIPPAVLVNGVCVITPPPPPPPPSTLVPPLTMTVCDASAPPKCSTVVVKD